MILFEPAVVRRPVAGTGWNRIPPIAPNAVDCRYQKGTATLFVGTTSSQASIVRVFVPVAPTPQNKTNLTNSYCFMLMTSLAVPAPFTRKSATGTIPASKCPRSSTRDLGMWLPRAGWYGREGEAQVGMHGEHAIADRGDLQLVQRLPSDRL